MRILVAEDDPGSRRIVKIRLSAAGHEVVEAENGEIAWELFQREPFPIVVTDWMMPKLDGTGLIRNIRSSNNKSYTYIIMISAADDKAKVVTGLESGADEYLTKPFDNRELIARVASGERILKLEEQLNDARRQMEILAMQDGLTGVLNRRAIEEHAEAALDHASRKKRPISIILLDIDHFKSINDRYGHLVGDDTLRRLVDVLSANLRQYDRLGRWGGEEFIVILPDTAISEAVMVAERMRSKTEELRIPLKNDDCYMVQISLGVVYAIESYPPLITLIDAADQALYKAKQNGRNCVYSFDQPIQ